MSKIHRHWENASPEQIMKDLLGAVPLERFLRGEPLPELTARDTQFLRSARACLQEMLHQRQWDGIDLNIDDTEEVEEYSAIMARWAYDLVKHVLVIQDLEERLDEIPDLFVLGSGKRVT